jgi:xanthine/CO dehydrogenase XdhC/CoxF family maturation factor
VKHWHETAAILDRIAKVNAAGGRAALASVVRISGSAYRRPGARFLVEQDGGTLGGVSGGCLEADVRETAREVMRDGKPRLLHYDTTTDEETVWGLGLGCEGAVDVFLQPAGADFVRTVSAPLQALMAERATFAATTVVAGPQIGRFSVFANGARQGSTGDASLDRELASQASSALEGGEGRFEELGAHTVATEVFSPPPRLFIFGAGDDARPLSQLAATAGFDVTVVDHRPAYLTADRFPPPVKLLQRRPSAGVKELGLDPSSFAVVQTHALQHDRDWLGALIEQPAAYVGLLGPRARKEELVRQLGGKADARLYAPVGLDLGADGPEQVAISIVGELLSVHGGRQPRHLRDKPGGIHEG